MKQNTKWYIVLFLAIIALGAYLYYGNTNHVAPLNQNKMSVTELKQKVNDYLNNNQLEIGDIFVYEDTDYYFSIEEKDTGRGAFELLVNPYTGSIYPEPGPNRMWNEKYGMHHNMMGDYDDYNNSNGTELKKDQLIENANQYVHNNINNDYNVTGDGYHFYGYYTFHIFDENQKTVGMLSVNSDTGSVWLHTWHGKIEQVIEHKE
jgi:hypothetical protein